MANKSYKPQNLNLTVAFANIQKPCGIITDSCVVHRDGGRVFGLFLSLCPPLPHGFSIYVNTVIQLGKEAIFGCFRVLIPDPDQGRCGHRVCEVRIHTTQVTFSCIHIHPNSSGHNNTPENSYHMTTDVQWECVCASTNRKQICMLRK